MPPTQLAQNQALAFYGMLQSVRTVTTADVALSGIQNLNGATGVDGDRILVVNQTTPSEDGIYIMRSGSWERAGDAEVDLDLGGMFVPIDDGNSANEVWRCTNAVGAGVVGTNDLTFEAWGKGATDGFFEQAVFTWNVNGPLATDTALDGIRLPLGEGEIIDIAVEVGQRGNNGNTIIDIHKHTIAPPFNKGDIQFAVPGTTIYTTQANRPTIPGSNPNKNDSALLRAYAPNIASFGLGDYYTIDIDQVVASVADLTVLMIVRYNNG
jgi:hypothetical protein